jgi:hypothetical protein
MSSTLGSKAHGKPSVFDLLDDIEKRPNMFIGWGPDEWGKKLDSLEFMLVGYGHAVFRHGIDDPGKDLFATFSRFLRERYGWEEAELGPIRTIQLHTANDEEAWNMVWKLLREFRSAKPKKRRTP